MNGSRSACSSDRIPRTAPTSQIRPAWSPCGGRCATPVSSAVRFRLDAHPVIDGVAELLFAPEIALGGLYGHVAKQELDLIQFATGEMAQPRASTPKVMRGELLDSCSRRSLSHNFPKHLWASFRCPRPGR